MRVTSAGARGKTWHQAIDQSAAVQALRAAQAAQLAVRVDDYLRYLLDVP